jgi:uncharacterized protein (TIGR02646 family)
MIKINRTAKPNILQKNERKWLGKIQNALTGNKKDFDTAINKYQHEEIKTKLIELFRGRCAYCESKITHIGYGHIEHFRPKAKSKYPLLAVKWTNLLLSCERCNIIKGDQFPTPKLINPCIDNPSEHFLFDYDVHIGIANVLGITPRGKITESTLQLNRDDLIKHRSYKVKTLIALARFYHDDDEAKNLLNEAIDEDNSVSEYLAFAQTIKEKYVLIPSSNE